MSDALLIPAGDKFSPWIKSCNQTAAGKWLKKFIADKTPIKSGENAYRWGAFSGWHWRC
jgi:hypothetical protein